MKFLSLLTLLPLTQLIQFRRHFLFVLFYSITFTPMQFLPVSTSPIQIDQNEIPLLQEIKELINRSFSQIVQRESTQISNINENDDGPWETVVDPKLYVITELDTDRDTRVGSSSGRQTVGNIQQIQQLNRERRAHYHHRSGANSPGHSLSIVNPLDVLRQRLLLEISRRRMRQSNMQIIANAEILKNIG